MLLGDEDELPPARPMLSLGPLEVRWLGCFRRDGQTYMRFAPVADPTYLLEIAAEPDEAPPGILDPGWSLVMEAYDVSPVPVYDAPDGTSPTAVRPGWRVPILLVLAGDLWVEREYLDKP